MKNIITRFVQLRPLTYRHHWTFSDKKVIFKKLDLDDKQIIPEVKMVPQKNVNEDSLQPQYQTFKKQDFVLKRKNTKVAKVIEDQQQDQIFRVREPKPKDTPQVDLKKQTKFAQESQQIQQLETKVQTKSQTREVSAKKMRMRQDKQFLEKLIVTNYQIPFVQKTLSQELRNFQFKTTLQDLPFAMAGAKAQKIAKKSDYMLLKEENLTNTKTKFGNLAIKFIKSLIEQTRTSEILIEPNFELSVRQHIHQFLKNNRIQLKPVTAEPTVEIVEISHLRGLRVIRNQNFNADEYIIQRQNEKAGYIEYYPIKQSDARYPEIAYKNINSMVLQVKCLINLPFQLSARYNNKTFDYHLTHTITFQNQLRLPPPFCQWQLKKQKYLENYRILKNQWYITDFDNRNPFSGFLYDSQIKKKFINKLV